MKKSLTWLLGLFALAAVSAFPAQSSGTQSLIMAQACGFITPCPDIGGVPDTTKLSSVDVQYVLQSDTSTKFEPASKTSWSIAAKYLSEDDADCDTCDDLTETATLDVTWNDATGYALVPTFAAPFRSITLCSTKQCGAGVNVNHSWGYTIMVNVDQAVVLECPGDGSVQYDLDQVLYTTTLVPNGIRLSGCAHTINVSAPNSQTYQVGDNGDWECTLALNPCPPGPSLNITY